MCNDHWIAFIYILVNNFSNLYQTIVATVPIFETVLTLYYQTAFAHAISDLFLYYRPLTG